MSKGFHPRLPSDGLEDFEIIEPTMSDNQKFLMTLAEVLQIMGRSITALLLVGFTLLLLVGDIVFGVIAWSEVINNDFISLILEAVPNIGIIAIGMAITYKAKQSSWKDIITNSGTGVLLFVLLAVGLGTVDALKDAKGVYDMVTVKDSFLSYLAVAFVFTLSAAGEVLALNLPEFFKRANGGA